MQISAATPTRRKKRDTSPQCKRLTAMLRQKLRSPVSVCVRNEEEKRRHRILLRMCARNDPLSRHSHDKDGFYDYLQDLSEKAHSLFQKIQHNVTTPQRKQQHSKQYADQVHALNSEILTLQQCRDRQLEKLKQSKREMATVEQSIHRLRAQMNDCIGAYHRFQERANAVMRGDPPPGLQRNDPRNRLAAKY